MNTEPIPPPSLKKFFKGIPVLGPAASRIAQLPMFRGVRKRAFPGSASFWENRYRDGGTSGLGSYGRLAEFKAEILNQFVSEKGIRSVFESGCGDGAQLALANYPQYVGVDVAATSLKRCQSRFADDTSKRFFLAGSEPVNLGTFDLAMSLDVVYHLVEDAVFDVYMRALFGRSHRYVVIYASNNDATSIGLHVRHRKFTNWIDANLKDWRPSGVVPNRYPWDENRPAETSFADFYFFELNKK